eukprot:6192387-Pleurochrysis_carterae.AAC.3
MRARARYFNAVFSARCAHAAAHRLTGELSAELRSWPSGMTLGGEVKHEPCAAPPLRREGRRGEARRPG